MTWAATTTPSTAWKASQPAAAIGPDAALPFYLLSHRTLCRDVPAGKLITLGDLDMPEESTLLRLRREQDRAFGLVK